MGMTTLRTNVRSASSTVVVPVVGMGMTTCNYLNCATITSVVEACRWDGYDNSKKKKKDLLLAVVEACRLDGYDNPLSSTTSISFVTL